VSLREYEQKTSTALGAGTRALISRVAMKDTSVRGPLQGEQGYLKTRQIQSSFEGGWGSSKKFRERRNIPAN
jgi:hypothetical protein